MLSFAKLSRGYRVGLVITVANVCIATTSCSQLAHITDMAKPQLSPEQAHTADSFVDSVGVQTHISYIDTAYGNWPRVLQELKSLGIRHIRDGLPTTETYFAPHQELAAAGIGCTCGFAFDPTLTTDIIVRDAERAKDVEALEAPNECNAGGNCGGGGALGIQNVVAYLTRIHLAGQQLHVPVLGPSFTTMEAYAQTGPISSKVDYSNLHVYFGGHHPGSLGWGGSDPQKHAYGSIDYWIDQGNVDAPGVPAQITETGYVAFPSPAKKGMIPEDVEAAYTPRTLLMAYKHGVKRTFLYEVLDEFPDTGYGLLRHDFSPKPAFTETKALIGMLKDPGPTFIPSALKLSLTGADKTLEHALFQKRDGTFYVILWLEQSSYDAEINKYLPVTAQDVSMAIGSGHIRTVTTFDSTGVGTTKPAGVRGQTIKLSVGSQLAIVRIDPR